MGITGSKSPLERRNTVARRSQRRAIHNIRAKVERVSQDIKQFKATDEDDNFNALLSELEHLKFELIKKSKDLQPQVRKIFEITLSKIEDSALALENRIIENREKLRKKGEADLEKIRREEEENEEKNHYETDETNDIIIKEENEAEKIAASSEKRKTLEVKFVQIIPPGGEIEHPGKSSKVVSPEDKRKSILKVGGVPVMPGAMMNEISSKSKRISEHYHKNDEIEKTDDDHVTRVNEIINKLQDIECQIADFIGRKYGTQYHRIRDQLNEYLIELNQMSTNDEFVTEQVKLCKNYVGSNINFLDERAVTDSRYESNEDVFLHYKTNDPLSSKEAQEKFQRLTKTTAI